MKKNNLSLPEKKAYLYKVLKNIPKTSFILFPQTTLNILLSSPFIHRLIKIGWQQSRVSRNSMFEINSITDHLSKNSYKNYHLHAELIHYFGKFIQGEAYILVPTDDNEIFIDLKHRLLELNPDLKNNPQKAHPIFYNYELLEKYNFGLLCVNSLPIRSRYSITKYNDDMHSLQLQFKDLIKSHTSFSGKIENIKLRAFGGPRGQEKKDDKVNPIDQKSDVKSSRKKNVVLENKDLRAILVEYYRKKQLVLSLNKNMTNNELSRVLYIEL